MAIESIDLEKCIECYKCYNLCPMDVFGIKDNQLYLRYREDCQSCYLCSYECPTKALNVKPDRPIEIFNVFDETLLLSDS